LEEQTKYNPNIHQTHSTEKRSALSLTFQTDFSCAPSQFSIAIIPPNNVLANLPNPLANLVLLCGIMGHIFSALVLLQNPRHYFGESMSLEPREVMGWSCKTKAELSVRKTAHHFDPD